MFNINNLIRENIKGLKPYSSARDEFSGEAQVYLDANESPFNAPYNRYPDPLQKTVKQKIGKIKNINPTQIFLGNGSDEPIDLLFRAFCEPIIDNVVSIDPSYGMYSVSAGINNVEMRMAKLNSDFSLDSNAVLQLVDNHTKLIFLCSPNNPSANLLDKNQVLEIVQNADCIVVIDEAYIDFAPGQSWLSDLDKYPNMVILQTFSKAWGMAALRMGMAFASTEILAVLNKIKYPYNINILTQQKVLELIDGEEVKNKWVETLLAERATLAAELQQISFVEKVYPSDANFLLVKMVDAREVYLYLTTKSVIVRDRSKVVLCDNCLRITVGNKIENETLISELKLYSK